MKVTPCTTTRDPRRCCAPDCTAPAVHAGFTTHRGRLVEHRRCAAHSGELERVRQMDERWKAVAG